VIKRLACLLVAAGWTHIATAQDFNGQFSTLFMVMPDISPSSGRQTISELRSRLFAEGLLTPADTWHFRAGLFVDALLADRGGLGSETATAAVVRPADVYAEYRRDAFDVRVGVSRIVWGRLDEFQPTDVVNPVDLSRFILEGRREARLPVALVRGRLFLPRSTTLEGIVVPFFRAGRFDQLEERTSPFRLAPFGVTERHEPADSWRNVQGGARLTSTIRRFDWGVSAWRGFEHFPTYIPGPVFVEVFPRFTMIGADFETVRGPWGVRGEFAWFHSVSPRSFEGGIGADRRAGNYRVALNVVVSRADDTDVTFVAWAERSFARETRTTRLFAVYDPSDDTAFVRAIAAWSVRDNLSVEASGGWLTGDPASAAQSGTDVLALLAHRDFLYAGLKVHF